MSQLRVNGIANSGGTGSAVINANGVITEPYKPAFHAYPTVAQTSAGIGAMAATTTNVGNCYSTSTYKFTAPVSGNYFFTCTSLPNSSVNVIFFKFRKNGVDVGPNSYIINSNETITMSMVMSLSSGETADVYFYSDGFEQSYTSFSGFLIG